MRWRPATVQHFEYVGLVACVDVGVIRTPLVFLALYSLAVLSHDGMVPLLQFMIIPALDSMVLRDFITHLEIYGMDDLPDDYYRYISPPPDPLNYIQ
jgi:hypothetical protein